MKPSVWVRMDSWVRHLVPFGVTVLLLIFTAIPTHLPNFGSVSPMLTMMGVYYWAIYRPDLLPAWAAFVIGLLADVVGATPLGVNALVLLLVQATAASQRKFFLGKSFLVAWWAFGLLALCSLGGAWLLVSVLLNRLVDPLPALFDYAITLALFPIMTWLLTRTQLAFLKDA